jgi:hypothetical protein
MIRLYKKEALPAFICFTTIFLYDLRLSEEEKEVFPFYISRVFTSTFEYLFF